MKVVELAGLTGLATCHTYERKQWGSGRTDAALQCLSAALLLAASPGTQG